MNNEVHIFLIKQWFEMLKGLKKVVLIIEVFFFPSFVKECSFLDLSFDLFF